MAQSHSLPRAAAHLPGLRRVRLLGATGAVLMAIGALGAGAQPVLQNPTQGVRVLGLFSRIGASSLAMCITGVALVVLAWLMLGRYAVEDTAALPPTTRITRAQLDRTVLLWALPLVVAPPMFSRDVYSYLAQSQISALGLNPYKLGPGPALGIGNVLTRTVPNIWRDTPDPYGPLFLWLGRSISELTGDNIIAGIFLYRLLELGGVALIVWALPRLARRLGVSDVAALWLGAANPLVLFHLICGIHNEALMLGLMLAGFELAMDAIDRPDPRAGRAVALLVAGCALIALSWTVKLPSLLAMGFVAVALARRLDADRPGRQLRHLAGCAALTGLLVAAVTIGVSCASRLGFGWLYTFNVANSVRSWMSLPTALGVVAGYAGVLLGLGDHTISALVLVRPIAIVIAALVTVGMLVAVYLGRLPALGGLGISFGVVALCLPVAQPWYFLWGLVPLAAWATRPGFRLATVLFTVIVGVILMPSGADYEPFTIVEAALSTIAALLAVVFVTRRELPWRVTVFGLLPQS